MDHLVRKDELKFHLFSGKDGEKAELEKFEKGQKMKIKLLMEVDVEQPKAQKTYCV